VDLRRRRVERSGTVSALTSKEAELLAYLVERVNQIVSRDELLREVWGYADSVTSRAPDTAVRTLRKKIEAEPAQPSHILSEYGEGYRFVPLSKEDLKSASPSADSTTRRTNLGPLVQALLGRQAVLTELEEHFKDGVRLVSLVGGPGLGKTTTAMHFAALSLEGETACSEVWVCELASARTVDDVARLLSDTLDLGVDSAPGVVQSIQQVGAALSARGSVLLVLDNFEHLSELAPSTLSVWLDHAPALRMLVTSRERLRLREERVVELAPLDMDSGVMLFRTHAEAVGASLGEGDDTKIQALVEELEGIPLAIELAASRVRILGVEGVRNRLASGLSVLKSSLRDPSDRHRTLQAAIDWSWELLSPSEQAAFSQLSVFRGGFGMEEAEGVWKLPDGKEGAVVLESLVDKSLVHFSDPTEPRFDLYASLRAYARERLEEQGSRDLFLVRHAETMARCAAAFVGGGAGSSGEISCDVRRGPHSRTSHHGCERES
jgi:predicted ATPase/DNA-binding winged helix-turn-helix (wHTH) protein